MSPFPTAEEMRQMTLTPLAPDTICRLATLAAIADAAADSLTVQGSVTTGAVATTDMTESQIIALLSQMAQLGYTVTPATDEFTLTWQR